MARQNDAIRNKLNQILNSQDNRSYLQDFIVTMRDGRYVIPVKAGAQGEIPPVLSTISLRPGATLFIEPQIIVNLNNELRELELAEEAEIAKILQELSEAVAEHYHDIKNNQKLLPQPGFYYGEGKTFSSYGRRRAADEYGWSFRHQKRQTSFN